MNSITFDNVIVIVENNIATLVVGPGVVAYPQNIIVLLFDNTVNAIQYIQFNGLILNNPNLNEEEVEWQQQQ